MNITTYNFVINLEDREDRRAEMEKELWRVGWGYSCFCSAARPSSAGTFPSIGSRGCFLSHLDVLRRGEDTNGHVLIMEDDLDFAADFSRLWLKAFEELQSKDWSIFYPAHVLDGLPKGLSQIDPSRGVRCSHFMVIHRDAIPKIIDGLETILSRPAGHPMGGPMHVDGAYTTIRLQNPALKTYVFSPSLGYQRSSRSDIADLRFFDKIEVLRPAFSALRRWKSSRRAG